MASHYRPKSVGGPNHQPPIRSQSFIRMTYTSAAFGAVTFLTYVTPLVVGQAGPSVTSYGARSTHELRIASPPPRRRMHRPEERRQTCDEAK